MKKLQMTVKMDDEIREARQKLLKKLRNDERILTFLQKNGLDGQFLEKNAGALGRWIDSLNLCRTCQNLETCRQPMKGKVLKMDVVDGFLVESYVSCRKEQVLDQKRSHQRNYRLFHGDRKDLETSLNTLDVSGESREYMQAFLEVIKSRQDSAGVFLYGQPGTGKTYLLTCLANDLAREGKRVSFVKTPLFIQDFKQSLDDYEYRQTMLGHLKFADVLFLDDLGSEGITKWTRDDILFPVLDYRLQQGKKTYFSSNYTLDELIRQYQPDGDQVASLRIQERIRSLARPVRMAGKSRR